MARQPKPKRPSKTQAPSYGNQTIRDLIANKAKSVAPVSGDWLSPFMSVLKDYAAQRGYEVPVELRQGVGMYQGVAKVGGAGKTNSPLIALAEAMGSDPRVTPENRELARRAAGAIRNIDLYQKSLAIGKQEVTPLLESVEYTIPSGIPGQPTRVRTEKVGETQVKAGSSLADVHVTDRAGNALFWKTPQGLVPIKISAQDMAPALGALKSGGRVYQNVEKGYDPVLIAEDFDPKGAPLTKQSVSPVMDVYMRAKERILGRDRLGAPNRGTIVTEGKRGDWVRITNINSELSSPKTTPQRRAELEEERAMLLADAKPRSRKEGSTEDPRAIAMDLADEFKQAMGKIDRRGVAPMSKIARKLPTERAYTKEGKPLPSMVAPSDLPPGDTQVKDPDSGRYMFKERGSEDLLTFDQYIQKKKASGEYKTSRELQRLVRVLSDPTITGREAGAREAALELRTAKQPKERPTGRQPGSDVDDYEAAQKAQFARDFEEDISPRDRRGRSQKEELKSPKDRIVTSGSKLFKAVEKLRAKRLQQIRDQIVAERAKAPIVNYEDKYQRARAEKEAARSLPREALARLNAEYQQLGIPRRQFEISAETAPIFEVIEGRRVQTGDQERPIVDVGVGGKKAIAVSGSTARTGRGKTVEELVGPGGRGKFGKKEPYYDRNRRKMIRPSGRPGLSKSDLVRERQYLEAKVGQTETKGRGGTESGIDEGSASLVTGAFASGSRRAGLIEGRQKNYAQEIKNEVVNTYKSVLKRRKKTLDTASDDQHMEAISKTAEKMDLPQDQVRSIMAAESEAVTAAWANVARRESPSASPVAPRDVQESMFAIGEPNAPINLREIADLIARRAPRRNPLEAIAGIPTGTGTPRPEGPRPAAARRSTGDIRDIMTKLDLLATAPARVRRRLAAMTYGGFEPQ